LYCFWFLFFSSLFFPFPYYYPVKLAQRFSFQTLHISSHLN
jgi:hypothetical protein